MYYLIVNPVAGRGRCMRAFTAFSALLKERGIPFEFDMTQYVGHASILAKEAVAAGRSEIIVMGGDGTVHEVVISIAHSDVALCIYPCGSGNDLARVLQLPSSPQDILNMLLASRIITIDLGTINDELFCNVAGFGFDVEVIRQVNKLKRMRGMLAYLLAVMRAVMTMRFHHVRIQTENDSWEGEILLVAVCNGQYFGGGMRVSPQSDPQDGLFHVTVIRRVPRWWVPLLLPRFIAGTHMKLKICTSITCASLTLQADEADAFQLDGQLSQSTPASFSVHPSSLRCFVPVLSALR